MPAVTARQKIAGTTEVGRNMPIDQGITMLRQADLFSIAKFAAKASADFTARQLQRTIEGFQQCAKSQIHGIESQPTSWLILGDLCEA
jgi:hypothetical protein